MDIYGLIGKKLPHSKSPEYFNQRFEKEGIDAEYRLFEIDDSEKIHDILNNNPNLKGLNVTIPYKRSLNSIVDISSQKVQQTGALNCLKIEEKNGQRVIYAHNTDIVGLERSLKPLVEKNPGIRALILGTGGSAHTAAYVFRKLGVFYYFVSRTPAKVEHMSYSWLNKAFMSEYRLIINCTPIGMYPNVDQAPEIPFEFINSNNICFDCVYNPEDTLFLKRSRLNGAQTISGKQMFEDQANASWNIWMH